MVVSILIGNYTSIVTRIYSTITIMFSRIKTSLQGGLEQHYIYWLTTLLVVGTGWLFRLRAYWFNRSIWMDEAALANNVIQYSLGDLVTWPLMHGQSAPVGFLAVVKLLVIWISESEKVLRLVPLGAGLLSVAVAAWIGALVFEKRLPRLVFTSLVSFSPILIFYSTEFKQYILDVCLALLILGFGFAFHRIQNNPSDSFTRKSSGGYLAGLGLTGFLGIWFSQSLVFFLFAVGTLLFWQSAQRKNKKEIFFLAVVGVSWLGSFGLSISLMLNNISDKQHLFEFWEAGFAPAPFSDLSSLKWYLETGLAAVFLAFREYMVSGPYHQLAWYGLPNLLVSGICFAGGFWLFVRYRPYGVILFLTGLAAWAASYLEFYALRGRLFLFIVPVVFLCAASAVDFIESKNVRYGRWLLSIGLVGLVFITAARFFLQPFAFSEIRRVLPALVEEFVPGSDRVAVSQWSMYAYEYYTPRFGLNDLGQPLIISSSFVLPEFLGTICALPDHGRMWLVFSHRMTQAQEFLDALIIQTPVLDIYESTGAGIYLFDFSSSSFCPPP